MLLLNITYIDTAISYDLYLMIDKKIYLPIDVFKNILFTSQQQTANKYLCNTPV